MSAANASFDIIHIEENLNNTKFEVPTDPKDTNGLKVTTKFLILESSNAEDVLYFVSRFDDLVLSLNVPEGLGRYRLLPTLLGHDHKKTWTEIVDRIASDDKDKTQDNFETIIEEFLLTKMDPEISLDLKEWLRTIKKPRSMSIAEFVERLRHLNN